MKAEKLKTDGGNFAVWRSGTILAVFRFESMADLFVEAMNNKAAA